MSRRRVNRTGARPSYRPSYSRQQSRRRRPVPNFSQVASGFWIRLAVVSTLILLALVLIARGTAVSTVKVEGNHLLPTSSLVELGQKGLKDQWFGRNVLLINTSGLGDYLLGHELGLKEVKVKRQLPHALVIKVTERQPSLNWKTNGVLYLLDADGTIIGPTGGSYAKLPIINDSNNLPVKTGDRVVPTAFVRFCQDLTSLLPGAGQTISGFTIPASTSEVYVQTAKGITIKFDTTRPVGEEVDDLRQVLAELTKSKKSPAEYIDLRIEHKAYYK